MYADNDEVVYTLPPPPTADAGAAGVQLRIQQTMEAEDLCAIFDDAWLGSRVWEATTTFCDRLCAEPPLVPSLAGSSVLELGAGTGIGGMVAAALGAADVVTTDMESPDGTLNLIHHNIEANRAVIEAAAAARVAAPSGGGSATPPPPRLRGAALDWTAAPSPAWRAEFEPADGFDTILAAECIYTGIDTSSEKRPVWSALADTICALAKARTAVYVCSKERGMQLSDDESDDEEVRPAPAAAAAPRDFGDGSLVVQFKRHMEQERGFRATVLCEPEPGAVQGLWLLRMQRVGAEEVVAELQPEPEPELTTVERPLLAGVMYINMANRTDRRKGMEEALGRYASPFRTDGIRLPGSSSSSGGGGGGSSSSSSIATPQGEQGGKRSERLLQLYRAETVERVEAITPSHPDVRAILEEFPAKRPVRLCPRFCVATCCRSLQIICPHVFGRLGGREGVN